MTSKEIGQAIRERRRALRLTQAGLAELALCSKPTIIAAEQGKATLRLDKLLAILAVLGLALGVVPEECDA